MTHPLPPILPTGPTAQQPSVLEGWPLVRLGFRPFYIGAALLACLSVPLWIAIFLGQIQLDLPVSPLLWHAHEMLFGFAAGVIIGFLLTAVKAWTGLATRRGAGRAGNALAGRTGCCGGGALPGVCRAGRGPAACGGNHPFAAAAEG